MATREYPQLILIVTGILLINSCLKKLLIIIVNAFNKQNNTNQIVDKQKREIIQFQTPKRARFYFIYKRAHTH